MEPSRDIQRVAARQHGSVRIDQLRDLGLSPQVVRSRTTSGWLLRRHRGVYAVGHMPRTRESRWMAAVLALGDHAVLSHRSAAALWGIVDGHVPTEVTVRTRQGMRGRDGIVVHRIPLPPEHVTVRDGIPVTTVLRAMLDVAAVYRGRRLARAFEQVQVKHNLRPDVIGAEVLSRRGYRGNARLGALLADAVDPARVRSVLELRFLRMCSRHAIPRPLVNQRIGPWTPDFLWADAGIVVETDGERFHRTNASRRRDLEKDRCMSGLGYRVLRLTWADVTERPAQTARLVHDAISASR